MTPVATERPRSMMQKRDAKKMRGARPFVFTNLREGKGVDEIAAFIEQKGGLTA